MTEIGIGWGIDFAKIAVYLTDQWHSYKSCTFRMNASQKVAGLQTPWKPRNGHHNQKPKVEQRGGNPASSGAGKETSKTMATSTHSESLGANEGNGNACQAWQNLSDGEEVELRCGCKASVTEETCGRGKHETEVKTPVGCMWEIWRTRLFVSSCSCQEISGKVSLVCLESTNEHADLSDGRWHLPPPTSERKTSHAK